MMKKKSELERSLLDPSQADDMAFALNAITGTIPLLGSAIGSVGSSLIPNQRLDRIARFVIQLNERISQLETDDINRVSMDDFNMDLVEESLLMASRALTNQRIENIAELLVQSLKDDELDYYENKTIFDLLSSLTDRELIILASFDKRPHGLGTCPFFRETHKDLINYVPSEDDNWQAKQKLHEFQLDHLMNLGLLDYDFVEDYENAKKSGEIKMSANPRKMNQGRLSLSSLGQLFLDRLGMRNEAAV